MIDHRNDQQPAIPTRVTIAAGVFFLSVWLVAVCGIWENLQ